MKKILLSSGSGIATSTVVNNKFSKILDEKGFKGKYQITQCSIADAVKKSEGYDFVISTTVEPAGLKCPYVSGVCCLTGVNTKPSSDKKVELMEK